MNTPLSIALIEEYAELRDFIASELRLLGHKVLAIDSAESLNDARGLQTIDLMITDINLPGEDGLSLARRMRQVQPNIGIIIMTARSGAEDRSSSYDSGADICLTKPLGFDELSAAISSLMRRIKPDSSLYETTTSADRLKLHLTKLKLSGKVGIVDLTTAETAVLVGLANAPSNQLDYWQLIELLNKQFDDKSQRLLEVQISRVRGKMLQIGAPAGSIKSLRLKGYQLCYPVEII
jgi:DNA-binding response OmpR family regulator